MKPEKRYHELADFFHLVFPRFKVQKISINAGFTCPNRDGTKGWGGCTYCNNQTFSPDYCQPTESVSEQLERGIRFFAHKYPTMRYLAYFEALSRKCFVLIEYGVESTLDRTLERINRGHTAAESEKAIRRTAARGIYTGAHLILGLPGESRADMLHHAEVMSRLPLTTLILHQLQLIRHTRMAKEYEERPEEFHFFTVDAYIDLVIDFIERLPQSLVRERFVSQSPKALLIKPDWGLKNYEFTTKVNRRLAERNTYQGRLFNDTRLTI